MPEKTTPPNDTPALAPAPAASAGRAFGSGCLGCGGIALATVLVVLVLLVCNAGSTDYPRVAPEKRASDVFRYSQEAYNVMGFRRSVRPGVEKVGVSTENTFSAGYCYDGGWTGMEDKTVDGAYRLSHKWALDHVPESQAVSGLRRLHRRLTDEGWQVSSYHEGGNGRDGELYVQRDGGDQLMSFDWYADRQYFVAGATVPCAYDPGWQPTDAKAYFPDSAADSLTAPVLAPSSARYSG